MNGQQLQETTSQNEQALRVLMRAITLSQGNFSIILVRCNYSELGHQIYQRIETTCHNTIDYIRLPPSSKTLYTAIKHHLGDKHPPALMILGLESVVAIDDLLAATNQVRDSFRKHFTFPLVLWCSDDILRKFRKLAPDFYSWTSVPIHFCLETDALVQRLNQVTDSLFAKAMEIGAGRFPHSSALYLTPKFCPQQELKATLRDLKDRGQGLDPILEASLWFVWGLNAHANDQMKQAKELYAKSIKLLIQQNLSTSHPAYQLRIERLGCVLFYSGVWWRRYAVLNRENYTLACGQARDYYRRCIELLQRHNRPELTAKFIVALGEVLHRLGEWQELSAVAHTAIELQKTYFDPIRLAYSYGLLAEVALTNQDWSLAKQYAEKALNVNEQAPLPTEQAQHQQQELQWAQRHYQSLYLLLLAQAQWHLEQPQTAVENLERASSYCNPGYDPQLYVRILETLRLRYFDQKEYLKAFQTKQQQRSIGQQYRLQAFVGAGRLRPERQIVTPALSPSDLSEKNGSDRISENPNNVAQEISASGRKQDLDNLIDRIRNKQYKLTILHGQSGVGKSSMVNAGLVPALQRAPIEARNVIPVVSRNYSDWCQELGSCLAAALEDQNIPIDSFKSRQAFEPQYLIEQLEQNEHRFLQTVLIFDQFEEFFFNCSSPGQQKAFFDFLRQCLDLAYVKVILALREDYLHYLLACDNFQIEAINNDILGRQNRYPLGNLSVENTKLLIQRLTQRSQFKIEGALIDRLTDDLAKEFGEVRPIELQVVGMQLQEKNVTTLAKYTSLGKNPKETLIGQFLEQVIRDCGPENEEIANLVLFLLTDEKGTRPMKTMAELSLTVSQLMSDDDKPSQHLGLILEILVESGLVLVLLFRETPVLQEVPPPRYQLVHDYLVELIRQKQEPALVEQLSQNQAELEQLRKEKELIEARVREEKLQTELAVQQEQLQRAQKQKRKTLQFASVIACLALTALGLAGVAWRQTRQAREAELQAMISETFALSSSGEMIEALIAGIKAGRRVVRQSQSTSETNLNTISKLLNVVHSIKEFNQLEEGHNSWVSDVSFGPDGMIASASDDNTVQLWDKAGKPLDITLQHNSRVNSVRFGLDGKLLATASVDRTIKLWDKTGNELAVLDADHHTGPVNSLSFSPDGKLLASASDDGKVILWDLKTYERVEDIQIEHTDRVRAVSFNPNPDTQKVLVTAGWDNKVKLWDYDGNLLNTFRDENLSSDENAVSHADKVSTVSFSPDGQFIASGGLDNKIKLWDSDGNLVQTLEDHTDRITSLAFNPSSQVLISASGDNTLRFWRLNTEEPTFDKGDVLENIEANSVRFLEASDDDTFAVAGNNNDVRLFRLQAMEPPTLRGHNELINSVDFDPVGTALVSGGDTQRNKEGPPRPGNIILWDPVEIEQSNSFSSLGRVLSIGFSPNGEMIASAEESIAQSNTNPFGETGSPLQSTNLPEKEDSLSLVERKIILRDTSGKPIDELILQSREEPNKAEIKGISFSSDSQYIAIAQAITSANEQVTQDTPQTFPQQGRVTLWDPLSAANPLSFETGDSPITNISFHPNAPTLITAHEDGTLALWDIEGNLIFQWRAHEDKVTHVRFSPDGRFIASGGQDTTIQIWDALNGTHLRELTGHTSTITGIDFQDDQGKVLAASSVDGDIRLWNTESEEMLANLQFGKEAVNGIRFSPDGQTIAAATGNRVILWNLDMNKYLLKRSCDWLSDYLAFNPNVEKDEQRLCP